MDESLRWPLLMSTCWWGPAWAPECCLARPCWRVGGKRFMSSSCSKADNSTNYSKCSLPVQSVLTDLPCPGDEVLHLLVMNPQR